MFRVKVCRYEVSNNLERIHAASACACASGRARPDNLIWLRLYCLCLNSFVETAFGTRFGARFWIHFWPRFGGPVFGLVNKKQEASPQFGSILVPVLEPFWDPTHFEHFCLLGCLLLKLVVLGCLTCGNSYLSSQRLLLHRVFEGRGGESRSKFCIVVVASMLCLAKPCRYLGGSPMWPRSCCFWAPI